MDGAEAGEVRARVSAWRSVAREQKAVFLSYKLQAIQLRVGTQGWLMRMVLPRLVPKTPQA